MATAQGVGRSAMRKALWRIVPLIALAYLCAYMDRVNVSFAATQMNADLGFTATIYGLGGGLFFLGYALFEIPSNLMAVRFGPRKWLARIMVTWGLLSAGTMLVSTPLQFYVVRFLLGVAEAGFYPGVIYYFASWFPVCHRGRAVSRFYLASPLAAVVMGSVSGWLLALDGRGGLEGWQWLFLVQGLPSVIVGLMLLALLPDRPEDVTWLTAPEKTWIADELAREQALIGEPAHGGVLSAFRNPRVLMLGTIGVLIIGAVITFNLSAPMILAERAGLTVAQAGYLIAVGGVLGALVILIAGNHADRHGDRWLDSFWMIVVLALSLAVIALAPSPFVVMAAFLAFAGVSFTIPMLQSSGWGEVLHVRELAVGAAAINTMAQIGAFVSPFGWGALKDATGSFTAGLWVLAAMSVVQAGLMLVLRRQIRAHRATRLMLA